MFRLANGREPLPMVSTIYDYLDPLALGNIDRFRQVNGARAPTRV